MASSGSAWVIAGAVVLVTAAAGGAVYYFQNQASAPPAEQAPEASAAPVAAPPAAPHVAPAPALPAAPASTASAPAITASTAATPASTIAAPPGAKPALPDSSAEGTGSVPDIATVDFSPTTGQFTITKPSGAYVAASGDSPQMYPLQPGIGVRATEQSKDGKWVIAVTEDGQAAFLPAASLGPYQPSAENSVPAAPEAISGPATVVDTATLTVNGQKVALFGIEGETGVLADGLQDLITAAGPRVTCQPHDQTYVCTLPNGTDVARAALYNGAARPGQDASDDYRQVSDAAKSAHKGIWR
jgi:endonuclease YncB( thermonuclease family)